MPRLENSHGSVAATRFRARPCSRETGRSLLYPDVHAFRECRLLRRKTIPDAKPMPSVIRFGDHVRLELHPLDPRVATVVLDRSERRNAFNRTGLRLSSAEWRRHVRLRSTHQARPVTVAIAWRRQSRLASADGSDA